MSKDIWHTTDEAPKPYEDIAFYVDGYLYFASYQPQYNQYGIFGADKVEKWCYVKELSSYILALETGNKDLSDKIGKLKTELDRTRKALESIKKEFHKETMPDFAVIHNALKTALEQKD